MDKVSTVIERETKANVLTAAHKGGPRGAVGHHKHTLRDLDTEDEDESDEEAEEFAGYLRYGPRKEDAQIDRAASMRRAILDIAKEKGVHLNTRLFELSMGVQRMAHRKTAIIASFYTNYDLGEADLPSTEDIEKLRTSVGSECPPGWYLDYDDCTWGRY